SCAPPPPPRFPYTTLFRSRFFPGVAARHTAQWNYPRSRPPTEGNCSMTRFLGLLCVTGLALAVLPSARADAPAEKLPLSGLAPRSEEHTSELQSRSDLVCR